VSTVICVPGGGRNVKISGGSPSQSLESSTRPMREPAWNS
jgi:hypothetical protein